MKCRFCGEKLEHVFCDLGATPISTAYVDSRTLKSEKVYPLCAYVCEKCKLVQVPVFEVPENIFKDYSYFSSVSNLWLEHCRIYTEKIIDKYNLNSDSLVVEVASNDGYLLKYFLDKKIPVLGVDPAENVTKIAIEKGIETICDFFGATLAKTISQEYRKADLIIGNNVLAHVPDINDFVKGLKILLKENSIITLEFPHLLELMEKNQFDTIYHEHFSYISIITAKQIFNMHDLDIFDVEQLSTHGGSVRIYVKHIDDKIHSISDKVEELISKEIEFGLDKIETYEKFNDNTKKVKRDTLRYLIDKKNEGKRIAAFGAPAKGNTFLNYCGIGKDFIDFTVDETPYKQGLSLPGIHIPIYPLKKLYEDKPDIIIVLPWNWIDEIIPKISFVKEYGGEIVTFIPEIRTYFNENAGDML